MYQTILMDPDIHKGTEINDISHGSLQYHARSQIFDLEHVTAQDWFWHILTRITGRRFQFLYDIPESQFADFQILCKLFVIPDFFRDPGNIAVCHIRKRIAECFQQLFRGCVGFRVYTGGIQRVFPITDAHEAGTLFIGFWSKLGYFQKLGTGGKFSVFFAVDYNIFGNGFAHTGDIFQQGSRSGV